jgi:formamidopyrimidine-DNA glycosylase
VTTSKLALRQRAIDRRGMASLVGAKFLRARRHGKYLLLDLSDDRSLLVHLGMAGRLLLVDGAVPPPKHTHVDLALSSGRALRFVDPRRFGIVRLYATKTLHETAELSILGPDPIDGSFDEESFFCALQKTKRDLKAALLDQGIVAGLGNIYVSEALFEAKLSPRRRAHRLSRTEASALFAAVHKVLRRGVENRGTSFSDYVDANGEEGWNQRALSVYGRAGEACRTCKTKIRRLVQAGRSTFFCPRCQATR